MNESCGPCPELIYHLSPPTQIAKPKGGEGSSPLSPLVSPLLMEPRRVAAAAARPESESESSKTRQDAADTRWLETLSEPELGLLIGLKEVAVARASNAGHPHLADKVFHLRALRALAFVLLQESKERLRQASWVGNASILERLALLNDPDHPQEVVRPSQDVMPMPSGIHKKRKRM
ncbi:uncharacterized protein LOC101761368 [Setaria italica]|uniref:uncharacterized protein LOC101761368 n=1 Tax=Setaria italica TaxID=4555 RepID=UPI000BE60666|nr:uncharacterized protein LOC101761368 [Setaria italica]